MNETGSQAHEDPARPGTADRLKTALIGPDHASTDDWRYGWSGAAVTLLLGVGIIVFSLWFAAVEADEGDIVVIGEVVAVDEQYDAFADPPDYEYRETIGFIDPATGQRHEVSSGWSTSRPRIGSERKVAFPPGEPERAKILSVNVAFAKWLGGIIGALFVLRSLWLAVIIVRRGKHAAPADVPPAPMTEPATGHAAGWLPDPHAPDTPRLRYWDGSAWTEHTHDG